MEAQKISDIHSHKSKLLIKSLIARAQQTLSDVAHNLVSSMDGMDFENLSDSLFHEGKKITKNMLETLMSDISNRESDYYISPVTGNEIKTRGKVSRTIQTRHGDVKYERNYFYDRSAEIGHYPIDQELLIAPQRTQYDLQKIAAELIAEMSFERAASIFKSCTGENISDYTLHKEAERIGEISAKQNIMPGRESIEQIIKEASIGVTWRPVLVVTADGAFLPTRPETGARAGKRGPGEWQEAKGFRIYLAGNDKITQLISWHQISDEQEFSEALKFAATLIPVNMVRIALVSDGAQWVQNRLKEVFPTGKEVLDYFHCTEHVHQLAKIQYEKDQSLQVQWIESTMSKLYYGDVKNVINGLSRMQPNSKLAEEEIRKLKGYLQRNKHRINYESASRSQMPKGSGAIESANKFICQVRIKRSGSWWYKINGNKMLKLRCSIVNGTFHDVFKMYKDSQKCGSVKPEKVGKK